VPTAVRLLTANSAEVEQLVREGRAELGLIESPVIPPGLSHTTVGRDEMVLVVAPDHPWSRRRVLLDELADTALVARESGSGTRQAWEDEVRTRLYREPASPLAVMSTTAAVRSAVAEGLAPAVLSRLAVADDIRLGRLVEVPLADAPLLRPITALWRGGDGDLGLTSRELIEVAVARTD
jgi:DNA-binding transcriptional LysR family regulator